MDTVFAFPHRNASSNRDRTRCEFLRVASARQLLRQTFQVYRRHFLKLTIIAALPIIGFEIPYLLTEQTWLEGVISFVSTFSVAAVAIAVSDICRGNEPSVRRTYRRLLSKRAVYVFVNALVTGAAIWLVILVVFLGALAASAVTSESNVVWVTIVIALIAGSRWVFQFLFVAVISAVEEKPGIIKAARRSFKLGKGYRGRILLFLMPVAFLVLVVFGVAGALLPSGALPSESPMTERILVVALLHFFYPIFMISIVLMYYDLRARQEGFTRMLVQELNDD